MLKHPRHLEHGTSRRGPGVEALLVQEEVDPQRPEFLQELDQSPQRPAQPVDRPRHDEVELVSGRRLQQGVEARPLVSSLGAGDVISIEGDDLALHALGDLTQDQLLVGRGLTTKGRDPAV